MELLHSPQELRTAVERYRTQGKKIGFVPTMGALHSGHLALAESIRNQCDIVVLSIFVNPIQFGPQEDLAKYPRTLSEDCRKAEAAGVDIVFAPSAEDMYPQGFDTTVSCGSITRRLEGAARPGHFDGVTTVVLKLFHMVQPSLAVFGQKDAQQVLVVQKMVRDLSIPIEIQVHPTIREADGLAMSSRNSYLHAEERSEAPRIYAGLQAAQALFLAGERDAATIRDSVAHLYDSCRYLSTEYISIADFSCCEIEGRIGEEALLSVVCRTTESRTRLIDNVFLRS